MHYRTFEGATLKPGNRKPETGIRGRKPESGIHKLKKTSSSNLTKLRNLFCIAFAGKK